MSYHEALVVVFLFYISLAATKHRYNPVVLSLSLSFFLSFFLSFVLHFLFCHYKSCDKEAKEKVCPRYKGHRVWNLASSLPLFPNDKVALSLSLSLSLSLW